MSRWLILLVTLAPLAAGCPPSVDDDDASDDDDSTEPVAFRVFSDDFLSDEGITHQYDCDQALDPANSCGNPSPAISWEGTPDGTMSFVLIFDDVSFNNYPHWAVLNIPADATGLEAGASGVGSGGSLPDGATELDNANFEGYLGSCPGGVNHYRWRLWALDTELDAATFTALNPDPWAAYEALTDAANDARIERVEMCHVFDGANNQR